MNEVPKNIAVLTGKRGGYGAMKPMLRLIDQDPSLRLSLIVTDQHLNPAFGATIGEVERDFTIAGKVAMDQTGDTPVERSRALGRCLERISDLLAELKPDLLVLYGDRGEVLAAATAALHLQIPLAHLQGGDVSGNADELIRHAVTKLAHLHYPSTEDAAERLIGLGEEAWRVNCVGDNHVDPIVAGNYTSSQGVRERFAIKQGNKPIIVLYHPETTRKRDHYADMKEILDTVLEQNRRTIIVYPCSDAGYQKIIRAVDEVRSSKGVSIHKNIDAPDFHGLLAIADVMVGNSSAGLIETPYFGLPAINIGERQKGRLSAENVLYCEADKPAIEAALDTALNDSNFRIGAENCSRPFGDGKAYERVVEHLKSVAFGAQLLDKRMTY